MANYWQTNKHKEELKRPGKSTIRYRVKNNIWEKPAHWEPLRGRDDINFVKKEGVKGKGKAKETSPEIVLDVKGKGKAKETSPEIVLDVKGKGKAKDIDSMSEEYSEYFPDSSSEDRFEEDTRRAMDESNKEQRDNNNDKKGESSKGPKLWGFS